MKRIINRIWFYLSDEKGAVIILVAFLLVFVLLGIAALTVDVGYLYTHRRHLQNTADAAALAAAWELPWDNAAITETAEDYIKYNHIDIYDENDDYLDGVTVKVSNPDEENNKVKVEITKNYPLFFALAPPIGQTDADVYAMAVAIKEYTFLNLLPFIMLEYQEIVDEFIDEINDDPDKVWKEEWNNWETNIDAFYSLMKAIVEVDVSFWDKGNVPGNFGVADMRDFVDGMGLSGNPNAQDIQYILKQGLNEDYCSGVNKQRRGRPGFVTAIESSNPGSDGYKLSRRLAEDDDFFVPLVLQGVTSEWKGNSYEDFYLGEFIIGHFKDLKLVSGNKVMEGTLYNVYTCGNIPDEYKMWYPVLIE